MIPILAIPHLNRPDLLRRCVASIDHPIGELVIIQNGRDEDIHINDLKWMLPAIPCLRLHHIQTPNLGVGSSWNYVMLAFSAPYWMFVGNDIEFHPGTLARMDEAAGEHHRDYAIFYGNQGHGMFIQTVRGTRNVGLYDPNLYPAYNEDCDWSWRLHLTGEKAFQVGDATATHGTAEMPGSCTIHSDRKMRDENHRTHGNNNLYYVRKWGGVPGREIFRSPFNQGGSPAAITFDPTLRDKNIWNLA